MAMMGGARLHLVRNAWQSRGSGNSIHRPPPRHRQPSGQRIVCPNPPICRGYDRLYTDEVCSSCNQATPAQARMREINTQGAAAASHAGMKGTVRALINSSTPQGGSRPTSPPAAPLERVGNKHTHQSPMSKGPPFYWAKGTKVHSSRDASSVRTALRSTAWRYLVCTLLHSFHR